MTRPAYMKLISTILALAAVFALAPATSQAATTNRCSGYSSFQNRAGYHVELSRYRNDQGMACSSVRYVVRFLRHKLARQTGWPNIRGSFYDGYVTWWCFKRGTYRWSCEEYDSMTGFSFTGRAY